MYLSISNDLPMGVKEGDKVEPFHTQAWIDRDGNFYAVDMYGHARTARILIDRLGIPALRYWPVEWDYDTGKYVRDECAEHDEVQQYTDDHLEMLGWVHLRFNGEFQLMDRMKNKGKISEDQFYVLQGLARMVDIREYQMNMLNSLREHGGDKWLKELLGMKGAWYAPVYE